MTATAGSTLDLDLDRFAAAKLWLISEPVGARIPGSPRDLPYLAHALYALVPVPSNEVPRMTCDEHWRIYVNPGWLATAPVPDIGAQLDHLLWHLLAEHADRARDQHVEASTAQFWTDATDATVAHTLAADDLCPVDLHTAADLGLPPKRSAEEYYAFLSKLPPAPPTPSSATLGPQEGCGSGCDGVRREHELPPDCDTAAIEPEEARQIRRRVAIDFREHARSRGTEPGDAWRWAARILEPVVAWDPVLAGAVRRAVGWTSGRSEYTYSRPSRRQSSTPRIVLPGMRRPVPNVAMVIDTSGSVDDGLLGRALGEVDGALRALGVSGSAVTVYSCDAAVHTVSRVRSARDTKLAGGGGTDMRVGIESAAHQRPRPDVIVVFTDGYTPWPATAPAGIVIIAAMLGWHRADLPPTPAWAIRVECLDS